MNVREAYARSLEREGHERDAAQEAVVDLLADLQQRLARRPEDRPGLLRRMLGSRREGEKGLYVWGGVGRGKTFLMDLFYETLDIEAKRRVHFHRMMHEVHARLKALGDVEDPLDRVAADIAAATRVLCFDEFFVSDIGDAMILGRLLDGLFARGATLVATSNTPPDDLYRDGLQRQRFLPAIDLLKRRTRVVHIGGDTDYRLRLIERAGTYLTPDDDAARAKLVRYFEESASSEILEDHPLDVNGREIRAERCAKGIAWFSFDELCGGPRSQNDYIELARWFPTLIVSGVPSLDADHENPARRFIALVDEFYDRRVKLVLSAATDLESLYTGRRLAFEFERTVSRLVEMQTTEYLKAPHLA
ncbi:MAG: cell division protein ZapE [Woeseiaceae bacterium]|nr:cell division protein ZapE [Woeseiaceae bacterium]